MFTTDVVINKLNEFKNSDLPDTQIHNRNYTAKELAGYIDHTLLKADATNKELINLCNESRKAGFASVCINPCNVELCSKELFGSTVKVCTVIGFPLGANETSIKIDETELALKSGAQEIDMVINIGRIKDGEQNYITTEITAIAELCHANNAILKVIIETALLSDEEKVLSCLLSSGSNADYVKTSTGFSKSGANIYDVALMKFIVGDKLKVKASGGVRNYNDAVLMIQNGASRLGTSSGLKIIENSGSDSEY